MCLFLIRHYFYFWWNITWPFLQEMLSGMFQAAFSNFQTHSKLNWQRGFTKSAWRGGDLWMLFSLRVTYICSLINLLMLHPASSLNSLSVTQDTSQRLIQQHKEPRLTSTAELTRSSETSGDINISCTSKNALLFCGKSSKQRLNRSIHVL